MEINSIGPVRPSSPFPFDTDEKKLADKTFGEVLKDAVGQVNGQLVDADDKSTKLALGEIKDPHEVILAIEKANLSLSLTVEIRDRVVEAYQAIMRMAV